MGTPLLRVRHSVLLRPPPGLNSVSCELMLRLRSEHEFATGLLVFAPILSRQTGIALTPNVGHSTLSKPDMVPRQLARSWGWEKSHIIFTNSSFCFSQYMYRERPAKK